MSKVSKAIPVSSPEKKSHAKTARATKTTQPRSQLQLARESLGAMANMVLNGDETSRNIIVCVGNLASFSNYIKHSPIDVEPFSAEVTKIRETIQSTYQSGVDCRAMFMALMSLALDIEDVVAQNPNCLDSLCSNCAAESETQATATAITHSSEKVLAMSAAPAGIA